MRSAQLAAVGLGLASCTLLLAACAPTTIVPPGPTTDEIRAIVAVQNSNRWQLMYPGEPEPVAEVVAYLPPAEAEAARDQCLLDAGIENIERAYTKLDFDLTVLDRVQRRNFLCSVEYPMQVADPELSDYLSPAQLGYLYDYLTDRVTPCLQLLGYTVPEPPTRDFFVGNYYALSSSWSPYRLIKGISADDRRGIDLRCPPPPIGAGYHA